MVLGGCKVYSGVNEAANILATSALAGSSIGTGVSGLMQLTHGQTAASAAAVAGKAIGASAAASAITGSVIGVNAVGATTTTAIVSTLSAAAAGIGAAAAASYMTTGIGTLAGPLGWLTLGADMDVEAVSWDCWKPVVRFEGNDTSRGCLLRDIATHENVKACKVIINDEGQQQLILENVWDEQFNIEFIILADGQMAAHAKKL